MARAASLSGALSATLSGALLSWFAAARRDLPWRTERTPYRVWLSEVMLQQTQVSRVVDYFDRFIVRFPDVHALALASQDDVLSLWSGLGYYSRGRNLHRAAQVVVDEHDGVFPTTVAGLRTLPGVGPYTAAAIASFTGGEQQPVVDGNVVRVLARLTDEARVSSQPQALRALHDTASSLLSSSPDPAAHNEAIMELGALVCTPRAPDCPSCPWQKQCKAKAHGTVAARPVKAKKKERPTVDLVAVVMRSSDGVYLEKRDQRGLFGGLWQPPLIEVNASDDARAAARALCRARDVSARALRGPVTVERVLTHRRLRFAVFWTSVTTTPDGGELFDDEALLRVGVSSAFRALLQAARDGDDAEDDNTKQGHDRRRP